MQIGFETTAAVPKRLRAVEEQPVQSSMQGERKIRQAPSTDQKKVRRAMQRKTAAACSCANHGDGSVTTMLCPAHADKDPCSTMAEVTGQRRKGSIVGGVCSACGWSAKGSARKTAANFSAGKCRMCEGNLIPMGRKSDAESGTMKAQCADCGTKHELQGAEVKKVSALAYEAFQNLPAEEKERLEFLADLQVEAWYPPDYPKVNCPSCGAGKSKQNHEGTSNGNLAVRCDKCSHHYEVNQQSGLVPDRNPDRNMTPAQMRNKYPDRFANTPEYAERGRKEREKKEKPGDYAYTASRRALLVALAGSTWVPIIDTTPYLSAPSMSAIARRAQSVLDTEEIL